MDFGQQLGMELNEKDKGRKGKGEEKWEMNNSLHELELGNYISGLGPLPSSFHVS